MLYVKFDDFEDVSVMGNEKDHGMFIPIKDGNVYAECERCGVVERITSPCEFIASTFRSRVNFNEGYELCEKYRKMIPLRMAYIPVPKNEY